MLELIRIKKHIFYTMIISVAAIILSVSVSTLLRVNSETFFQDWLAMSSLGSMNENEAYQIFVSSQLIEYFLRLIVPIIYGLQTYFAYVRSGVGMVYKAVWSTILFAILIVTLLNFDPSSVAYYVSTVAYVIIIISLLNIRKDPQKVIGG